MGMNNPMMNVNNMGNQMMNNNKNMGTNNPAMNGNYNNNNNNIPITNNMNNQNGMNPKIVDEGYRDYVKSTTEMDNSPEHLFGLSCLPEISKDTTPFEELFYWKSCC